MKYLITEKELLELRKILRDNEGENECIACGLCCKIGGKFFINIEQDRISNTYPFDLFSKDHEINTIQTIDFIPKCVGSDNRIIKNNLVSNEKHIIKPDNLANEIIFQSWFEEIKCQIYQERPILCRFYPYNSFPFYCMIGVEFFGENPKQNSQFMHLMTKYLYTYRRECLQTINLSFETWEIKLSNEINFIDDKNEMSYKVNHQKALIDQNSIWNLWGYLKELPITKEEKDLLITLNGKITVSEIINEFREPLYYSSWHELLLNYLIFELVEFPEEVLKVLLLGIIRF